MWEGIGIVSYLLINFWFTRIQANKAAILALTMNRVGDMGLSIGFFALFALFGSLDYSLIFSITPLMNETAITIIGILLLTGAMAKSAQIPLHSWLPGSMEGQTIITFYMLYFFFSTIDNFSNFFIFEAVGPFILPEYLERGKDGKFKKSGKIIKPEPLDDNLIEALVGELLGDGHLRFNKKGLDGKPKANTNAQLAMTLKSKEHTYYLWGKIYAPICTSTHPHPWPNPSTGKVITQYHFSSRALASLSLIHNKWYVWSDDKRKFIKIVPSDIYDSLTPIGLAHWVMGDGYWDNTSKTVFLCTDNFTFDEVLLLINVLENKFLLKATVSRRTKSNKELCWRIRFSGIYGNIELLRILVKKHMIPSMLYKLNL